MTVQDCLCQIYLLAIWFQKPTAISNDKNQVVSNRS